MEICAGRCSNKNTLQCLDIVSEIPVVPDIHRESFASFDAFGNRLAADLLVVWLKL